jgi:hypothetical protein
MTKSVLCSAGLCLSLVAHAWAEEAARENVVRAEAPIVAGNAVNARKLAVASALRQAVEQALGEAIKEAEGVPGPSATPQLRASLASAAQRFVRSYRIIDEQKEGGVVRVMVEVDVDTMLLRREIDRARGATAPQMPAARQAAKVMLIAGPAPAAAQVAAALGGLGVRAPVDPSGAEGPLLANAARQSAYALSVVAQSGPPDRVRGTSRVLVKCSIAWRFFTAGLSASHGPTAARNDEDFGFAADEAAARNACLASAADKVARAALAVMRAPVTSAAYVTLKLEIPNVGAIPVVLQALKRLGTSSANEVRYVTANAAEIRVYTRTGGPLLVQALARELGGKLSVVPIETALDRVAVKVGGVDVPPPEENR